MKKTVSLITAAALLANAVLFGIPSVAEAGGNGSGPVGRTVVNAPAELRARIAEQTSYLASVGRSAAYSEADFRWNPGKRKPDQVRDLRVRTSGDVASDVKRTLSDLAPVYGLSGGTAPSQTFSLLSSSVSKVGGTKHYRIAQSYSGIAIVGGDLLAHVDKYGTLRQIDGDYVPWVRPDTVPAVGTGTAVENARKDFSKRPGLAIGNPELAYLPEGPDLKLAWTFTAKFEDPKNGPSSYVYYVDAKTGKTLRKYDAVMHEDLSRDLSGSLLTGEGGATVSFSGTLDSVSGRHRMYEPSVLKSYVWNDSTNGEDAKSFASRSGSYWTPADGAEVSAAYNIQKTLEFFRKFGFGVGNIRFNDPNRTMLPFFVHYGNNYNNAFWMSGEGMYFGDGDGTIFTPLTTMDVIAHEFAHAWTENNSNLVYQNEPGALNESFSDIIGATVEILYQEDGKAGYPNTVPGKSDWLIGEDLSRNSPYFKAIRDMRNPGNTAVVGAWGEQPSRYLGSHWYMGTDDNGGVHINSGVQNFFFQLLSDGGKGANDGILYTIDGIGIERASKIAVETNSNYVTSTTDYPSARQAWIDAANAVDPSAVETVKAAWDAVGVTGQGEFPLTATYFQGFDEGSELPSGWTVSGNSGWELTTATGSAGSGSIQSSQLDNLAYANLNRQETVWPSEYLVFDFRTSTEGGYDFLNFYLDGQLAAQWSGENAWTTAYVPLSSGAHSFDWRYVKDELVAWGIDQVGLDEYRIVTLTGGITMSADGGSGSVFSKNGLTAGLEVGSGATYVFLNDTSDTSVRGFGTGTVSLPLSDFPEGTGSLRYQYQNAHGLYSAVFTKTFYVDGTAPSSPTLDASDVLSATGTYAVTWEPSTDTGAGLREYAYEVSSDPSFPSSEMSGSTSETGAVLELPDGTWNFRVTATDLVGNSSKSETKRIVVDSKAPAAPFSLSANGGKTVDEFSQYAVTLTGVSEPSESGSTAIGTVEGTDVASGLPSSWSGTAAVGSDGSFSFAPADFSRFADGFLAYAVRIRDAAGNLGDAVTATVSKSSVPSNGSVSFSGAYLDSTGAVLTVSAEEPLEYSLSGSGLERTYTGSLSASGSASVAVELTNEEGLKTVVATFTDAAGTVTQSRASATLDLSAPDAAITSFESGATAEGTGITVTGTVRDAVGIASVTVNGLSVVPNGETWSATVPLSEGVNTVTLDVSDLSGKRTTVESSLVRVPKVLSFSVAVASSGSVTAEFSTDVNGVGVLEYGTGAESLTFTAAGSSGSSVHSVVVGGLEPDTEYFFRAASSVMGKSGSASEIRSVRTPKTVTASDIVSWIAAKDSVWFEMATETGAVFDFGSGSANVANDNGDGVAFDFSGMTISTSGWNGVFRAPTPASTTGSVSEPGYAPVGTPYAIGNGTARLALSGGTATVSIKTGSGNEGKTLRVYHSDDGVAFQPVTDCVVQNSTCAFRATHFSYYALGEPNDSAPDAFSFPEVSGAEPSKEISSDPVTLTGFNAPAAVTVVWGSFSVNESEFQTGSAVAPPNARIRVKAVSSSSSLGTASVTVTVGGVSATFTVRTKSISSGGGSSGGGSSGGSSSGGGSAGGSASASTGNAAPATSTGASAPVGTAPPSETGLDKHNSATQNPFETVAALAKSEWLKWLKKGSPTTRIPLGVRNRIDRTVTAKLEKMLPLQGKTPVESAKILMKASQVLGKLSRAKKNGAESALWKYVSESFAKKSAEMKKKAAPKTSATK